MSKESPRRVSTAQESRLDSLCDPDVTRRVSSRYAIGVTDHVMDLMHGDVHSDPVARQYLPQTKELQILPEEDIDPVGDFPHTPVKGVVHRHQDRVLLKLANICAVYCRFCFRRDMIGPGSDVLSGQETQNALAYIQSRTEINEVIFTGGDPFIVSPRRLSRVTDALCNMPHVRTIRFHTRVPVADPGRLDPALYDVLRVADERGRAVYVAIHINHTQEITEETVKVLRALRRTGCILLSQSVLLKGVNDDPDVLATLFTRLVQLGVKPYYLHHPDLAPGTGHFRVSIREGQDIMAALRDKLSGLALPQYVLDIPGGYGKVPVERPYVQGGEDGLYNVHDHKGVVHRYPDRPGGHAA